MVCVFPSFFSSGNSVFPFVKWSRGYGVAWLIAVAEAMSAQPYPTSSEWGSLGLPSSATAIMAAPPKGSQMSARQEVCLHLNWSFLREVPWGGDGLFSGDT